MTILVPTILLVPGYRLNVEQDETQPALCTSFRWITDTLSSRVSYRKVPAMLVPALGSKVDVPKSAIFTEPQVLTSTFEGLMSPCTSPMECM